MKKSIFTLKLMLALFVAMLTSAATVQAQTTYNLKIAGVDVTDANKDSLAVIPGVIGTVTYDTATKTLRLENATITAAGKYHAISAKIDGIKIEVIGNNTIKTDSSDCAGINLDSITATIKSSGTLNANATKSTAIRAYKSSLNIENCVVNATGFASGISGAYTNSRLSIDSAIVTATGTRDGSIVGFNGGISLTNTVIHYPANAQITNGNITDTSGTIIKTEVKIVPTYNLWICGVQLNDANKDSLAVIPGVTGTVTYYPTTKTLRLKNASIAITGNVNAIYSKIENLTIELIGDSNTINVNAYSPLHFEGKPSTILGGGTLTVINSANDYAICVSGNASLTIKNCTVNAIGNRRGITGSGNQGTLSIENATVTAKGTSEGSITYFANITLNGCIISEPIGGRISTDAFVAVRDSVGNIIKDTVKIVPTYNLWICDVQVTDANKDKLSAIPNVTGRINYNSNTKTLTLDSVTIAPQGKYHAISAKIDGIKIEVIGNNTIKTDSSDCAGINLDSITATIKGSGTLNANATKSTAIRAYKSSLNIENCVVNATGFATGISGAYTNSRLSIDNAIVTAIGTSNGSIVGFNGGISLTNCVIAQPVGAKITGGNITDTSGAIIKTEVKIAPTYNLWICSVQLNGANKDSLAVIPGVTGTVSYNPITKILRLENSTLTPPSSDAYAIQSKINGLTINVVNNNTINSNGWSAVRLEAVSSIEGTGTFTINNPANDIAIYAMNTSLTIKNCTINAISGGRGISGKDNVGTLTIQNATVTAKGINNGSITQFANIILDSCAIFEPIGGRISKGSNNFNAVRDSAGSIIKDTVKIIPATVYNLLICEVPITSLNKDSLSLIPGVTGTVNYNPNTKTLTLNGATMSTTGQICCILSRIDSMIIEVIGSNTLTGNLNSPIAYEDNNSGIIQGNGTLNVINSSVNNEAIYMRNGSLTIKNCTLNAICPKYGIFGSSGNKTLTIENATVSALGTSHGSIKGFSQIDLVYSVIIQPAKAVFNSTKKAICDNAGNVITDTVKIIPGYDLKICGELVTPSNKDSLAVISGVSGKVSYNPGTKTLRLENATINALPPSTGILSKIEGLTIELIGNNAVNNNGHSTIQFDGKSGTILGGGTLSVTNQANDFAIFASAGASLTIKNSTINAIGGNRGITGNGNSPLTIQNATITAKGGVDGSITRFSNITLDSCAIFDPIRGRVSKGTDTYYSVRNLADSVITDTVKILPATVYNLHICGVQVTSLNEDNLNVIPGVTGTVNYNPATMTLTLNDATITSSIEAHAIGSDIKGLTVELKGSNDVSSSTWSTMRFNKSGTIIGNGTLNVNHTNGGWALYSNCPSLTIQSCTVNATNGSRGITGNENGMLTINNATITAKGTGGSITHFSSIILNSCAIFEPIGGRVSKGTDTYYSVRNLADSVITDTVKILPATVYNLHICGVQVTSLNEDNLNVIPGVTGTVNYNPATMTLTLNDATITSSIEAHAIGSDIKGLTVELKGSNDVSSSTWSTMRFNKSGTIIGNGTLNVNHTNGGWALYSNCPSLTIQSCTVNATNGSRGITGNENGMLTINNATITAKGTGGSITHFSSIILDSCAISEPVWARVSKGSNTYYSVRNSVDSVITDTVKILPATVYNLHICGVQVTSLNEDNLSLIPGVSAGTVSYNSDNKTLTLNDASLSTTGNIACIYSTIDGMIIEVIGNNTLNGNGWSPISLEGDNSATIEGSGTLNINNSANNGGIFIRNGLLNIKNCTLNVTAGNHGISSPSGEKTLTFDRATVSATGTNGGSIVCFKQIDFVNCVIIQPEDTMFNDTLKAICDASGNIIKTEVKIAPTYTIIFAAPENGTLTVKFNNADIISGDKVFMDSEITITATPDANYKLKTLTVNGTTFESGNTYSVVADVNIVAEFEKEDGIEEIDAQDITLYPNPVKTILYIETEEAIKAVHIYNVQGAVVVESIGDVREINLAHLPAGIYTLHVEIGKTVSTLRIIKN